MIAIITTSLKERIRKKELYIVLVIGLIVLLLCSSKESNISINGESISGFENILLVMHTVVNAIACILAIVLSISTIPNEYDRHTSHLVWIRNISQAKYHTSLTISNVLGVTMSVFLLYVSLGIYIFANGPAKVLLSLLPAFLITMVNVLIVSLFISVLSISCHKMINGLLGVILVGTGIFHPLLELLTSILGGMGSTLLKWLLILVPNLHKIQKQAYLILLGKPVDIHEVLVGLLTIWFFSLGLFLFQKKEA